MKYYELSDHLGSARMVISDRKLPEIVGGVPGKYRAEVKTFTNLYPFGMEEPGRYRRGMRIGTDIRGWRRIA